MRFAVRAWMIWSCSMCKYQIRAAGPEDLDAVTAVEAVCFPPEEAAGREAFRLRLQQFPERFFVAQCGGRIIGLVNGCASNRPLICDSMFETGGHDPLGSNQMIFGLAVLPEYQRQGIGAALLRHMIAFARSRGMRSVVLTCKEQKLGYYAGFGFENRGVSESVHGGACWYDMVLPL